jgi:hypothetical protein
MPDPHGRSSDQPERLEQHQDPPAPSPVAPVRPAPSNRGAAAGMLIVATILLCAAIGFGLGALIGAPVALGLVGVFAGLFGGLALVINRFRDI